MWQDRHPAAETQAAADGDDEAVYIRLFLLRSSVFGQLDCKIGNLKRDYFFLLWWLIVVESTTPWLDLHPLVLV